MRTLIPVPLVSVIKRLDCTYIHNHMEKDVNCSSLVTDTLEKANLFNNYFNAVFSKPCNEPVSPGHYPIVPHLGEF